MFTGIIEELGIVGSITRADKSARLNIKSSVCISDAGIGDSISVNGACLTLTAKDGGTLSFDLSAETLNSTDLADLVQGDKVNLERSLKQGGRLGGHFVTGHVDCVARVISKVRMSGFVELIISLPAQFSLFLAKKGPIAIDGVSLTLNNVMNDSFSIMLVPHTLSMTTLGFKDKGSRVNMETDILAKYTQNLIIKTKNLSHAGLAVDRDFLIKHGFI